MENPMSWDDATLCINEALAEHHKLMEMHYCGLSLPAFIKQHLEKNGFEIVKKNEKKDKFLESLDERLASIIEDTKKLLKGTETE